MLLICPFTIHGAWSGKSLPRKDEDEQTMARGELLLAEKSRQMVHGAFDLTAKYILANCFRVSIEYYIYIYKNIIYTILKSIVSNVR